VIGCPQCYGSAATKGSHFGQGFTRAE